MSGGFGDKANTTVPEFTVFKGKLYAATSRIDSSSANWSSEKQVTYNGTAELWYSSDGQRWEEITSFSPPFPDGVKDIRFMATSGPEDEFLYIGTYGSNAGDGIVYRSSDGKNFQQLNGKDSGFGPTPTMITGLAVKQTYGKKYLYAGIPQSGGAQLWRIPYDQTRGWQRVLDFSVVDPSIKYIPCIYVWNDVLYIGIMGSAEQPKTGIYQSSTGDLGTWTKNTSAGDGWDVPDNASVPTMIEFNGYLYAGVRNNETGGQIWRTFDGQNWQQVLSGGFGDSRNQEVHQLFVAQGKLWVAFYSELSMPAQVLRSDDGVNFVQSNLDGFGDPGIIGGRQGIIEFNGTIYWGGSKPSNGAEIWRLSSFTQP